MALHVQCPNGHPIRLGDTMAGKRVRCPKCREIFLVETDEEDAPPPRKSGKAKAPAKSAKAPPKRRPRDEDDERPAKKKSKRPADDDDEDDDDPAAALTPLERQKLRKRDKKERLKRVFTGLTIAIFKMWSLVLLLLVLLVDVNLESALLVNAALPREDRMSAESVELFVGGVQICIYLLAVMVMVTPAIGIASCSFCILTPRKSEAGGSIMTSLVFDVVPFIASLLIPVAAFNLFELDADKQARFLSLLFVGCTAFSLAALFMFIIFLRLMAIYLLKVKAAADSLNMLAWLMLMTVSGGLLMFLFVYIVAFVAGAAGGVVSLGVGFLISLIWFGVLYYVLFNGTMNIIKTLRHGIGVSTGLISEEAEEEDEEDEEEEDDEDEDEDED